MSIRNLLGNAIGCVLVLGWNLFNRFDLRHQLLSLYMHSPEKNVFENTIRYLQKKGFRFISTEKLQDVLEEKKELEEKTAVVTLDDAWRSNLQNVIPLAAKYQVPITIFTPILPVEEGVIWLKWFRDKEMLSQFPEVLNQNPKKLPTSKRNEYWTKMKEQKCFEREMMTMEEVRTIAKLPFVTIGGHTYSHPILPNCTREELEYELVDASKTLRDWIGNDIHTMAYPNGDFNDEVITICKKAGFELAFTTMEGEYVDIRHADFMRLPRNCVPNAYGKYESIARALGVWQKVFKK